MLIKYIKSVLWRVAKCLSYIEEARCLKVNEKNMKEEEREEDQHSNITQTWSLSLVTYFSLHVRSPPSAISVLTLQSPIYTSSCGPGSSVGIATELRAGRSGDRIPVGRDFPPVQTGPGAHSASCTMGTGSFPGVKSGRGVLLTIHPF